MEDLSSRLRHFIKIQEISNNEFARKIGVSSAQISHMLNGKSFGYDKLQKILSTYNQINPEWLINGAGPVYKNVNLWGQHQSERLNHDTKPGSTVSSVALSSAENKETGLCSNCENLERIIKDKEEIIKLQRELLKKCSD